MWYELYPDDPKHQAIVHDGSAEFMEDLTPTPQEEARDLMERLAQEVPPGAPYLSADEWDSLKGTASSAEVAAMNSRLAELVDSGVDLSDVASSVGHLALAS